MGTATKPRRRMPPGARRQLIRREGTRLFGLYGYAATRLDDVALAAGVTKPMVYHHFASKKDLYLAILSRHEAELPLFIEGAPASSNPTDVVGVILDGWLDYVEENSDTWLVIFRDRTGDAEIERARRAVNARASDVLAAFIRETARGIPPDEIEPTADLLRSGLAGLVLWWIDHPEASREAVHATAARACAALLGY